MNDPIGRTSGLSDDLDVESIPAGSTLGGGSTSGTWAPMSWSDRRCP